MDITFNGIRFSRRPVRKGRIAPAGKLRWLTNPTVEEIEAGASRRLATAAEARELNRIAAEHPQAVSLPGVHPSYRV